MKHLTTEQVKKVLRDYHDIPMLIEQRRKMIQELQNANTPSLQSPVITGMPSTGSGEHSNPTLNAAIRIDTPASEKAIKGHLRAIYELQETRNWVCAALATLDRVDRKILELAYMGPENPQKRDNWLRPPEWKRISAEIGYSESRVFARAKECLVKMSKLTDQQTMMMFPAKNQ